MVDAIEDLQYTNEKKWKIYGKGEYAPNDKAIFQFTPCGEFDADFVGFGIDFGFSRDETALVAVYKSGDRIYLEELLYEKGLVTADIADRLKKLDITKSEEIWADSAEPRLIEELYRMGFNIKPVTKGKDSIKFGINTMKNYKIFIHNKSQNLINEMYSYQYATDKYGSGMCNMQCIKEKPRRTKVSRKKICKAFFNGQSNIFPKSFRPFYLVSYALVICFCHKINYCSHFFSPITI